MGLLRQGTGVHTFSTNSQSLSGTFIIPSVTVTGAAVTLTNNNSLTIGTALAGTGILLNAATGTLVISGTCSVTTLTNNGIVNSSGAGTITSTTVTNNLTWNMSGTGAVTAFTNTATGVLNLSNTTVPTFTTLTVSAAGNTVNYTAAGAQTIKDVAYSNLGTSGSGTKTWTETAARVMTGNLSVGDGTTLTITGGFAFTVNGTTTIGTGTSGTLTLGNATGAKTFIGLVTINAGAAWTETVAVLPTFEGGITNSGTFTASTGVHTFSTNSQSLSGTFIIPSVTVTGAAVTLTNNNSLTIGTALAGTGILLNAATGTLVISGTCSVTTLTNNGIVNSSGAGTITSTTVTNNLTWNMSGTGAVTAFTNTATGVLNLSNTTVPTFTTLTVSAAGNTVNYTAAGNQTVVDVAYYNLTTSGSGTKTWTETAARVMTGNLSVGDGTTLTITGAFAWNVTGTTTIGNGTSGVLSLTNVTGIKTFTGAVTINAGGAITETAAAQLAFGSNVTISGTLTENGAAVVGIAGSLTNNGTYAASTGVHTFSGMTQTIGGTTASSIPSITFSGTYTNIGTLTVGTALAGTGALTNSATYTLNIGGTCSITTLTNNGIVNSSGTGAITSTSVTNNLTWNMSGTGTVTAFTNSATGVLNISSATVPAFTTIIVSASGNTVNYSGTGQTLKVTAYYNLTLSGGAETFGAITTINGNLTLSGSATATTGASLAIGGNLVVGDGTTFTSNATFALTVSGTTTVGGGTSGTLTISTAATNTQAFTGVITISSGANFTVSVAATISSGSDIVDNGTLSFGSGILNISGNLSGTGTVTGGTGSINLSGNWTQSGTFTANTSTVNYNGSSVGQLVQGGITYYNLQISNGGSKLLQVGNATVSNVLTLTSGTIATNSYSIVVSSGTVNRISGYVIGNLNLYFATGATNHTFDIGDASAYTPVAVSFASVTTAGSLTASTTTGDHPQIITSGLNSSKTANRYWTLTNSGIVFTTYNVVFTFVSGDLDPSAVPTSFIVERYNSGTWSAPTLGTRTATTTQATGLTAFGDFQLGNIQTSGVSNYTPTRTMGITYTSIATTGNAVESWRTSNISDNSYYDDNRSFPVPIGFDFWYDGTRYTQFNVSVNGFMDFDSSSWNGGSGSVQPNNPYGPYSTDFVNPTRSAPSGGAGTVTALAPIYYDLTTWQTSVPLGNSIKYLLTGTAPNRVLTVEWINMSTWTNQADTLNFQVKLYETTGVIEYYYGYMSGSISTTNGFGYVTGINAPSISPNPPTAAQLLCLQTANTNTFSNGQQNQLSTIPQNNSKYTFTPNIPATPTGLSFSNVTSSSMRLSWKDNADNELGYVIYRSDNGGVSYSFIRQLPAGSTYSNESGLIANTTYYWKVYAVTEGGMSAALSGSCVTLAAAAFISAQTGNWNTGTTWEEV